MMHYSCSVLKQYRNALGEGPLWDAENQLLYWIDGFGAKIFRLDWRTKSVRQYDAPCMVGSIALHDDAELFAALENGVYRVGKTAERGGDFYR